VRNDGTQGTCLGFRGDGASGRRDRCCTARLGRELPWWQNLLSPRLEERQICSFYASAAEVAAAWPFTSGVSGATQVGSRTARPYRSLSPFALADISDPGESKSRRRIVSTKPSLRQLGTNLGFDVSGTKASHRSISTRLRMRRSHRAEIPSSIADWLAVTMPGGPVRASSMQTPPRLDGRRMRRPVDTLEISLESWCWPCEPAAWSVTYRRYGWRHEHRRDG
jgi:hypothetical protein